MSGIPVHPVKLSITKRFRKRFKPASSASSPSPAQLSSQALISSTTQSPGSSSTQILSSSSLSSAGLIAANSPTTSPSFSHNLLDDALKQLSHRDRATLQDHILPNSSDVNLALEQALAAAQEKQRHCLEKRWRVTFAGREFILKEEADKVICWLNRVKEVGDVVVNADPVHAGLPWAGIRLLLEVRTLSPKPKPTDLTF
jgi:ankyrin repeat domain-containing protein 50